MPLTTSEITAALLGVIQAVADAIQGVGEGQMGVVDAALMTQGCTLKQFEGIVSTFVGAPLIERHNDLLR